MRRKGSTNLNKFSIKIAQKIKINGKEYSCSKEVAEHIKWLEIKVEVSKSIAEQACDKMDELQSDLAIKLDKVNDLIRQIKPMF